MWKGVSKFFAKFIGKANAVNVRYVTIVFMYCVCECVRACACSAVTTDRHTSRNL